MGHNYGALLACYYRFVLCKLAPYFVTLWAPASTIRLTDDGNKSNPLLLTACLGIKVGTLELFIILSCSCPILS